MDSKFIKSHQCFLERSHAVFWLKLILNSDQDLALSQQKQILTGLIVTKIYKNRTMKISLFKYSMLGYISPIPTSLSHIYWRNSCPTHIFQPTHQTGLCKNLDLPTVNHNRYIKLLWAQFPMETLRTETSQKSFIKTFGYNNKVTNKFTKRLPKPSNKEMYFTLLI